MYGQAKWGYMCSRDRRGAHTHRHTHTKGKARAMNRAQGRKIKTMHLCFHTFGLFNIGNVMLEWQKVINFRKFATKFMRYVRGGNGIQFLGFMPKRGKNKEN